jgi:hypothetical protein
MRKKWGRSGSFPGPPNGLAYSVEDRAGKQVRRQVSTRPATISSSE